MRISGLDDDFQMLSSPKVNVVPTSIADIYYKRKFRSNKRENIYVQGLYTEGHTNNLSKIFLVGFRHLSISKRKTGIEKRVCIPLINIIDYERKGDYKKIILSDI